MSEAISQMKTILIIDDEESHNQMLKSTLELTHHYTCLIATCGAAGLELVKQRQPDLVLLDINMPGEDSLAILRQIKAIAPTLPVAMLTAVIDKDVAKACFAAGAYEYLTKPVTSEHLETTLLVKLLE